MHDSTFATELPTDDLLSRINPALRDSFVPLPATGTPLTTDQLNALFSGATAGVLRDLVQLRFATPKGDLP